MCKMHRFRFIPSMRSLIWAFDLHLYILKYPMILLADSVCPCQTVQADLDLLCPHMCRLIWVYDAHLAHAVRLTQGYSIMQGFVSTSCQPYSLTLCILGKIFSRRHFEIFFFVFPRKKIWHFMQTVSNGDSLHEMSKPVYGKNKENIVRLSSAESVCSVVSVY